MIRLTPQAAREIRIAAARSDAEGMFLRITARQESGKSIVYGMGFDERRLGDLLVVSEDVPIVINAWHRKLLEGTLLDFVTLASGESRFVYDNPIDASCTKLLSGFTGVVRKCCRTRAAAAGGEYLLRRRESLLSAAQDR